MQRLLKVDLLRALEWLIVRRWYEVLVDFETFFVELLTLLCELVMLALIACIYTLTACIVDRLW